MSFAKLLRKNSNSQGKAHSASVFFCVTALRPLRPPRLCVPSSHLLLTLNTEYGGQGRIVLAIILTTQASLRASLPLCPPRFAEDHSASDNQSSLRPFFALLATTCTTQGRSTSLIMCWCCCRSFGWRIALRRICFYGAAVGACPVLL